MLAILTASAESRNLRGASAETFVASNPAIFASKYALTIISEVATKPGDVVPSLFLTLPSGTDLSDAAA